MCNAAVAISRVEAPHVSDLDKPLNERSRGDIKVIWIMDFGSGLAGVGKDLFKMSWSNFLRRRVVFRAAAALSTHSKRCFLFFTVAQSVIGILARRTSAANAGEDEKRMIAALQRYEASLLLNWLLRLIRTHLSTKRRHEGCSKLGNGPPWAVRPGAAAPRSLRVAGFIAHRLG
ncbi:hypothetical protein HZZ13_14615 [Bradyrhizobium sp. CNPSo 4010]|uniref:Uncharacterized protein n=1 Tax=Bradyrhizobium agreste TaxID=2751811 RepID=A0ABS0PP75_9BRAD|nr:hypothetical protein [Bradyrhizobium agreste]MBH5399006.1 hypothetical protein [Bradyrhizobium agreste]